MVLNVAYKTFDWLISAFSSSFLDKRVFRMRAVLYLNTFEVPYNMKIYRNFTNVHIKGGFCKTFPQKVFLTSIKFLWNGTVPPWSDHGCNRVLNRFHNRLHTLALSEHQRLLLGDYTPRISSKNTIVSSRLCSVASYTPEVSRRGWSTEFLEFCNFNIMSWTYLSV